MYPRAATGEDRFYRIDEMPGCIDVNPSREAAKRIFEYVRMPVADQSSKIDELHSGLNFLVSDFRRLLSLKETTPDKTVLQITSAALNHLEKVEAIIFEIQRDFASICTFLSGIIKGSVSDDPEFLRIQARVEKAGGRYHVADPERDAQQRALKEKEVRETLLNWRSATLSVKELLKYQGIITAWDPQSSSTERVDLLLRAIFPNTNDFKSRFDLTNRFISICVVDMYKSIYRASIRVSRSDERDGGPFIRFAESVLFEIGVKHPSGAVFTPSKLKDVWRSSRRREAPSETSENYKPQNIR